MNMFTPKNNVVRLAIIFACAFAGWVLCDLTMVLGLATMPLQNALIVHAIAAPIYFTVISSLYFRYFNCTTPLQTALIFVGFVMAMDFLVVALMINKSLDMFASLLGTWIPFACIFAATYITGVSVRGKPTHKAAVP